MFTKARLKLTVWYLFIIMAVSISFSVVIYVGSTREFTRVLRIEDYRLQHPQSIQQNVQLPVWDQDIPLPVIPNPALIQATKTRVAEGLFLINLMILFFSSFAGYFLAGRTLRPIKEMVDEQNRFITDASHELNTPLTSLKTAIEVNLRDKNFTIEKAKKLMASNLEDVNSLQVLSDELIKLNQYQRLNGNMSISKLLLQKILNQALEKVNAQAKNKKIKILINLPRVNLIGNEKSLTELFVILLDNAVKYSKQGKTVKVSAKKYDSKIQITVEDQGIGIAKEDLPFIFDRFYRAEKSRTKNDYQGYGLGLSIAKRIVTLHNGTISVESETNKGTKFTILLNTA